MSSNQIPGLQYPSFLEESNPRDAATKSVFDNLFYLRRVIGDLPKSTNTLTQQQVQQLVNQTIENNVTNLSANPVIVTTHAIRLLTAPTMGAILYEYDRGVIYIGSDQTGPVLWTYSAGRMVVTSVSERPTDLGSSDANFQLMIIEQKHNFHWNGSAWLFDDEEGGRIVDRISAPSDAAGWQLCDGSVTDYLQISGGDIVVTSFTTPNENAGGVYHTSIAAYTGVINAATAPTLSGNTSSDSAGTPTGSISAPSFTGDLATAVTVEGNAVTTPTSVVAAPYTPTGTVAAPTFTGNALPGHIHGVGTLTVSNTAQPQNLGVLRYFRR